MKALVFYEPNKFAIEEKPTPVITDGEVLLKVIANGLCGTDLKILANGHHAVKPPMTLGHEIVGEVIETKSNKAGVAVGDKVIVVTPVGCMNCDYCRAGEQNICAWVAKTVHSIGYYTDGGFAEFVRIPKDGADQQILIKIPETQIPLEDFAICEPLSCVINGQEKLKITAKDEVVVIGAGPIGCMHVMLAKASGAKKIYLVDIEAKKLALAKNMPVDVFIDSSKEDAVKKIMELTEERGADVVITANAAPAAQEQAFQMIGIRGRISLFGGLPKGSAPLPIATNTIHYLEQEIYGAFASNRRQYEKALELVLSGAIPAAKLVSHKIKLENIEEAIKLMKQGETLKVVVIP